MSQLVLTKDQAADMIAQEIEAQIANATVRQYDIMTRSEQKLEALNESVDKSQAEKAKIDARIRKNRDNVRKLVELIAQDQAASHDIDVDIQSDLASIAKLREEGVKIPPKTEQS